MRLLPRLVLAGLLLAAAFSSSCKKEKVGSLTVQVRDKLTKKPIKDVMVVFPNVDKVRRVQMSNSLGFAHFYDVPLIPEPGYPLTFKHRRYVSQTIRFNLTRGLSFLFVKKTYQLHHRKGGRKKITYEGLDGVEVSVVGEKSTQKKKSDALGRISFEELEATVGGYPITVKHPRYLRGLIKEFVIKKPKDYILKKDGIVEYVMRVLTVPKKVRTPAITVESRNNPVRFTAYLTPLWYARKRHMLRKLLQTKKGESADRSGTEADKRETTPGDGGAAIR